METVCCEMKQVEVQGGKLSK